MSHYLLHPKQAADGTNEELLNSPSVSDRADAKDYNSPFCAKTTEYDPIKTGRAISALKTAAGSSDVDYLQLAKAIAGTIELLARISPKGGDIQAWAEANCADLAQFVRSESRKHRRDSVVASRRKEALIKMHPEPEIGAPRDDIRSHLDKEVKDELEKDKLASGESSPKPRWIDLTPKQEEAWLEAFLRGGGDVQGRRKASVEWANDALLRRWPGLWPYDRWRDPGHSRTKWVRNLRIFGTPGIY